MGRLANKSNEEIIGSLINKHKMYQTCTSAPTAVYRKQLRQQRTKLNHISRGAGKHYFSTELSVQCQNNMRAHILNKRKRQKSLPREFRLDDLSLGMLGKQLQLFLTDTGPVPASAAPAANGSLPRQQASPFAGGFAFSPVTRSDGREAASCLKQLAPGDHSIPAPQVLEAVPGAAVKALTHMLNLSCCATRIENGEIMPTRKDDDSFQSLFQCRLWRCLDQNDRMSTDSGSCTDMAVAHLNNHIHEANDYNYTSSIMNDLSRLINRSIYSIWTIYSEHLGPEETLGASLACFMTFQLLDDVNYTSVFYVDYYNV